MKSNKRKLATLVTGILLCTLITGTFWLQKSTNSKQKSKQTTQFVVKNKPLPKQQFGLTIDSFILIQEKVQRNQFLSNILSSYQIDPVTIAKLAEKSKPIFNVKKITAGNPYTVLAYKNNPKEAAFFIYQPNPIDYVVYDLRDTLHVYKEKKDVVTKVETVACKINSSLYDVLQSNGADPLLSIQLANLYSWAIDFYTVTEDDWFKLQYERQYVDGKPVDAGHILSAIFSHKGKEFSAFYFQADSTSKGEYYDETGNSVRRAFLKAPLKFSRITSRFSKRRFHPVQGIWKAHLGTDYAAPKGTPIIATGSGVVIASAYTQFNGNYVKIKHNGTYITQYLHMSKRAVKNGQHVQQGQVIGYVGSTGLATGPHVCYRFWKDGQQIDALKQRFRESIPLSEEHVAIFKRQLAEQQKILSELPLANSEVMASAAEVPPKDRAAL